MKNEIEENKIPSELEEKPKTSFWQKPKFSILFIFGLGLLIVLIVGVRFLIGTQLNNFGAQNEAIYHIYYTAYVDDSVPPPSPLIIITDDGKMEYKAQSWDGSEKITKSKKISQDQFDSLVEFIDENGFFSLSNKYFYPPISGGIIYGIIVNKEDSSKEVSCHSDHCPEEFVEIRERIESLWGESIWEIGI